MSTLVFVLVFVALGIAVLLVALRAGHTGESDQRPSRTRTRRRLSMAAFALAILGLGIGIPAAVIGAVGDRDSIPKASVSKLTAEEKKGRQAFGRQCRNCHALDAAQAVAQVGPDLDALRPPKSLVLDAIENGRARGNGQMAPDLVTGEDAEAVAAFVAKAVGQTGGGGGGGGE
jgi:mono/diheme cytochrome c family protein